MYTYFFEDGAAWYTVPTVVGTVFFIIRLNLMLLGIAGDLDIDPDISDSGDAFQILSIQSIASFAMGFGWGGLGALRGFELQGAPVVIIAAVCGAGMVWILALLLKGVADLQSSGNIELSQTIGKEGEICTMIPPGGQGQISLVVSQRLRTYGAISVPPASPDTPGEPIPSGTRVRVISANPDNTVTVERV